MVENQPWLSALRGGALDGAVMYVDRVFFDNRPGGLPALPTNPLGSPIGTINIFTGRVQNVGFRYTVKDLARSFDVRGWVKNLADGKVFSSTQLKEILELLERFAKFSGAIQRHGGDIESYLGERDPKTGKLPTFMVKVREGNTEWATYFPGEAEVREFHEGNRDLGLYDDPTPEPPQPACP